MASHGESHTSFNSAQSDESNFPNTLNENDGDNRVTNEDDHSSYNSQCNTLPGDCELNGELYALATNYKQYKDQLDYLRMQSENDKAAMAEEFTNERANLQNMLKGEQQKLATLSDENTRQKTELNDLKNDVSKMNEDNVKLRAQIEKKDVDCGLLVIEHKTEVEGLEDNIRVLRRETEDLKHKLRITAEESLRAATVEKNLSGEIARKDAELLTVKTKLTTLMEDHETSLNRLREEHRNHLEREEHRMNEQMIRLKQKNEESLAEANESHASLRMYVDRSASVSTDETLKCITKMHAQTKKDMKKKWDDKESKLRSRIEKLEQAVEEARTSRYEDLEEYYAQEVEQMEKEKEQNLKERLQEIEELKTTLVRQRDEHIREKALFHRERENLLSLLDQTKTKLNDKDGLLKVREAVCDQHEATISDLKKELKHANDEEKRMILKTAADREEAEARHQDELSRNQSESMNQRVELEEELRKVEVDARTTVQKLVDDHSLALESEKQVLNAERQGMKSEKEEALLQMKKDAADREQQIKNAHEELVKHLEDEKSSYQVQCKEVLERLDKEREERLRDLEMAKESEERKIAAVHADHNADIDKLLERKQRDIDNLKAEYDDQLTALKLEIAKLDETLRYERAQHAHDLQHVKEQADISKTCLAQTHTETEKELMDSISEKENLIGELEAKLFEQRQQIPPESKKKKNKAPMGSLFKKKLKGRSCISPDDEGYKRIPEQST